MGGKVKLNRREWILESTYLGSESCSLPFALCFPVTVTMFRYMVSTIMSHGPETVKPSDHDTFDTESTCGHFVMVMES